MYDSSFHEDPKDFIEYKDQKYLFQLRDYEQKSQNSCKECAKHKARFITKSLMSYPSDLNFTSAMKF